MPTIKEIKPAGGGDYTTLQAWEDWADGEATADQHARCWTGGDLGELNLAAWTATPDADTYPKIYVADGEGHGGDQSSGAYIDASGAQGVHIDSVNFVRVEGLRIDVSSGIGVQPNIGSYNARLDSLLIHGTGQAGIFNGSIVFDDTVIVRNCLIDMTVSGANSAGIWFGAVSPAPTNPTMTFILQNSTVRVTGDDAVVTAGTETISELTINTTIENCILDGTTCIREEDTVGTPTRTTTVNNTISTDGTADDFAGSDNIVDADLDDICTDVSGDDYSLKDGSAAIDAGKTIAAVTDDIIGTARPQGDAYDIGAFETEVAAAASGGANLTLLGVG